MMRPPSETLISSEHKQLLAQIQTVRTQWKVRLMTYTFRVQKYLQCLLTLDCQATGGGDDSRGALEPSPK